MSPGRSVCLAIVVLAGCQPSTAGSDSPGDASLDEPSELPGVCWALEYGPATAGFPDADAPDLPPRTLRIWTDSTFPNSTGLLQVEAAPGFEGPGGGMVSSIDQAMDSIEVTWAAPTSSTHLRFRVFPDSMTGTAWHHGASGGAEDAARQVRAFPTECAAPGRTTSD